MEYLMLYIGIILLLLYGILQFLTNRANKKISSKLSELGGYDKIPDFGKYIIGLPNVDLQYEGVICGISNESLLFFANLGKLFGWIPRKSVTDIYIDRKTNISQRLTATRIITLGIFSLAAPKNKKTEEYCLVIEWLDETKNIQNTIFEFSGDDCAKYANNAFNRVIKHIELKPKSDTTAYNSSADEIFKLSKLKDEGIITEEEFEAKKKQLLGLE